MKKSLAILLLVFTVVTFVTDSKAQSKPTLIIVMQEKVMGTFGTTGYEQPSQAEITMMQKFNELGFTVVDLQAIRRNLDIAEARLLYQGDVEAARQIALRHEAEIAVTGSAISKFAGSKLLGTQMQSIQATLTARVVRSDDARVIGSGSAQAAVAHIDEIVGGTLAIEKAANQLVVQLSRQLSASTAPTSTANPGQTTVNITGLVSYRHLDFIMDFFNTEVSGVTATTLRSYSEGVAEITLDTETSTAEITRFIAQKKFKGFRLEPINVSSNALNLQVILDHW